MSTEISKIKFIDSGFDYIVCLNANLPDKDFFDKFPYTQIISADGAALKLQKINVRTDYIIGDLDSFQIDENQKDFFENTKVIKNPDQSTNDFEKILNWCIAHEKFNLLITGIHGGDLEHTLNNWSVFMRYSKKMNLCIYDNKRYAIAVEKNILYDSYNGEIISIIPQPSALISTKNLKWELDNFLLEMGRNEGARNCSTSNYVEIFIHSGSILFFFDSKEPKCPFFL
jgi:thiamine pyrophosphokinase